MAAKPKEHEDTREKLLASAKEIFAGKGYAGATVKEIADHAGVNISLISYHFKGKEGLLGACVEQFGKERLRDAQNILTPPESPEDMKAKLHLWTTQFLRCHVEEHNVCTILHREKLSEEAVLWDVFESTFLQAFNGMVKFIEAGKKKGFVKKEADAMLATSMMYAAVTHLGSSVKIQERLLGTSISNEKFRRHTVDQFLNILLNGIT